ncbi:AraC family transcriptional regulator [Biostraticola tofi]|uniref:AraC-like DNA-binding protein n=1 Tax=Biostraticola tofi TaxID=466109 RepID=A0A4R3YS62_9GAMM|nr:AraC family transcriptional regulator [Biostraticola tofi]TCV95216.1 AraC-like DNA-binding protein [Biostraticola tofi]
MTNTSLLDLIQYDDFYTEFRRVSGKSVDYYHWHQCLEVLYIESGVGLVVVDNQKFTLRPGRLFVFPQGKLHKVKVDNSTNNIYIRSIVHMDSAVVSSYLRPFSTSHKIFLEISSPEEKVSIYDLNEYKDYMKGILDLFSQRYSNSTKKCDAIALLLLNIIEILPNGVHISAGKSGTLSSKIMNYIEEKYLSKISLEDIAAHLNVSGSYASRTFKKETGGTIQEYIIIRRIRHSCFLLEESDDSIAVIAEKSGFKYVTYFIKCFSEVTGLTPLRYKNSITRKLTQ